MVKSPRWPHIGTWTQEADAIVNTCPADSTPQDLQGKLAPKTYTSMLWKDSVTGNFSVEVGMSFDYQMAPLVVFAPILGADADGHPEFREHWEVVLFNEGLNVWHHEYADGTPRWHLAAMARSPFLPGTKYTLKVSVQRYPYGARITVSCGDLVMGYTEHALPNDLRVGITGCEGHCHFYDFRLCTE